MVINPCFMRSQEIGVLMKNLPSENVIVTGDYNINLLSPSCKSFEEIMLSNNLITMISLATDKKPVVPLV